ncbi:hypothetical protein LSTR_LSTR014035 [Laodelphax striatellus]|uniref:Uncharacterized protein n=1 Tax=Laodelphax striatellus TaxID=195883 RepID=A0A482X5B9_LAOST|nr:hypothetical protein LSTR_LSTR014035 [Laodelphax striatellus]
MVSPASHARLFPPPLLFSWPPCLLVGLLGSFVGDLIAPPHSAYRLRPLHSALAHPLLHLAKHHCHRTYFGQLTYYQATTTARLYTQDSISYMEFGESDTVVENTMATHNSPANTEESTTMMRDRDQGSVCSVNFQPLQQLSSTLVDNRTTNNAEHITSCQTNHSR